MSADGSADGAHPIYVVSGGVGASGEQLAQTVLAQFPQSQVRVITLGNVRRPEQIEEAVARAKGTGGILLHTLVDERLRAILIERAREQQVPAIDLMGELLAWLSRVLGCPPLGQPGLYRQLRHDYFERVAAIDFALAHDDGKNPADWRQADVVLTGVSRTGKTPLSVYLSVLGWKVANVPIVFELGVPEGLLQLDRSRVVGLTIDPDQLLMLRERRLSRLGARRPSAYVDPEKVREEVRAALVLFRRAGFAIIDVTDKPIESSADEIIRLISGRSKSEAE